MKPGVHFPEPSECAELQDILQVAEIELILVEIIFILRVHITQASHLVSFTFAP